MIVLSGSRIPSCVCFIASLGSKFNYFDRIGGDDLIEYLIVFEKLKNGISDFINMSVLDRERSRFRRKFEARGFRERTSQPTAAQKFINLQMDRARAFLNKNPDVKVFPADKGGKVVIADLTTYKEKMKLYLELGTNSKVYFLCEGFSVGYVKEMCELKYRRIRTTVNAFFERDRLSDFRNLCPKLSYEPFVISRMYGSFKIHKEGNPIRPIVSATNCLGDPLAKWLRVKLEIVAKHVSKHQLKDSQGLFRALNGRKLNGIGHVIVTFDFDNMFTNIPFEMTKEIIRKYYHLIEAETSMPVDVFLDSLSFLVEECGFFTFEGVIYLRMEGLAMGNSLSQILAEITTSHLLNEALKDFSCDEISFLFKYVDDLIGGIEESRIAEVQKAIEARHGGMKLKVVLENGNREVDYLQMRIKRNSEDDNSLSVRWMQKEFSSKRILDFHSSHPMRMKVNVVREFIRNALILSSKEAWNLSINMLRKTLANSNYSYYFIYDQINFVMNRFSNNPREIPSENQKGSRSRLRRFIRCPYRPGPMGFIRKAIKRTKLKVSLAPSMDRSNARLIFANLKDDRDLISMTRSSFVVHCNDCNFSDTLIADGRDIAKTLETVLEDTESKISKHCRSFSHDIDLRIARSHVTQYRNRRDISYLKNVCDSL